MIGGAVIAIVFGLLILVRPGIWPALVLCAAIGAVIFLAALVVYVLRRERCERRDWGSRPGGMHSRRVWCTGQVTVPSQATSVAGVFMMTSNSTSAIDDGHRTQLTLTPASGTVNAKG